MPSVPSRLLFVVLVLMKTKVEAATPTTCENDTTTYQQDNLTVTFKNYCGKDITSNTDYFSGVQTAKDFGACLDACVQLHPLCYGFDFRTYTDDDTANCWPQNVSVSADAPQIPDDSAEAACAILDQSSMPLVSDDCHDLGPVFTTQDSIYDVFCGVDVFGGTVRRLPATSMTQCLSLCDQTAFCEAAAYESAFTHGFYNCYLKDATHGDTSSQDFTTINGAIKRASATGAASTFTSSLATSTATSTPGASTTSTPSSSSQDNSGLSTGAKAGIGVGVAVGVLLIVAIASFFYFRRKREHRNAPVEIMTERLPPAELEIPNMRHEMGSSKLSGTQSSSL